jgi:hypothetical protein
VKQLHSWQAEDGSVFSDYDDAYEYEALCQAVNVIMRQLGPSPVLEDNDYIEHESSTVLLVRDSFLRLAKTQYENDDLFDVQIETTGHNQTMVGRIIDDSDNKILNSTWSRFMSINMTTGHEYSQPYYAMNER